MSAHGLWERITFRLDPRTEGPEPQDIALKEYLHEHPEAPRAASALLAATDTTGHWVDIWIDLEETS